MVDISQISEEFVRCYSDRSHIYMIEHYFKTYDNFRKKDVPYILFPRQKDLCNALGTGKNVVTTKPRQAGITTTASAFLACELVLADPDSPKTVLAIGNTLDLAQQFVTKIRDFVTQLPRWFFGNEFYSPDEKSEVNKKKIFILSNSKELKLANGSRVVARSSGPNSARGCSSVSYLVFDEASFIENGKDVYSSALPTISTGGSVLMISTPNGKDQLYYQTYKQAKEGKNGFIALELKWYQDPRYNKHLEWTKKDKETGEIEIIKEPTLDDEGNIKWDDGHWTDMVNKGYKPRSPWYVGMCQKFNNDPQKIAQELDVSFLGSDSTVVGPEYIEMQRNLNVRKPSDEYKDPVLEDTWVWKPPYEGHRYLLGIDNSRGSADDATALEIIDIDGRDEDGNPILEQVLEYNGKLTGDAIGEVAFNYGKTYNNAFIIVEDIGGYGSATLLTLMNMKYENLYYDDPSIKTYTSQNDATPMQVTEKGLPGFHSSSVRFQELSHFADMVKTNQFKIRSSRVCNELDTWVFKNGRIDHKDGCHDDTLTCLAMVLFVMEYSINKMIKAKNKDKVMLKSMIVVNSRANDEKRMFDSSYTRNYMKGKNSVIGKKYNSPILISTAANRTAPAAYAASMWLLK